MSPIPGDAKILIPFGFSYLTYHEFLKALYSAPVPLDSLSITEFLSASTKQSKKIQPTTVRVKGTTELVFLERCNLSESQLQPWLNLHKHWRHFSLFLRGARSSCGDLSFLEVEKDILRDKERYAVMYPHNIFTRTSKHFYS